jgi:hypothetical protein
MTATGYTSTTGDARKVSKTGDTMTGELVLPDSSPDSALSAATKGYVDGVAATKASTVHAASHADGGADEVTLTQDQITGLVAALAALLPKAGGTITGTLTVEGYTTLAGGQFNSDFAAFGNMTLIGTGKSVRFRRDGDGVDVEGSGAATVVSVWSGAGFTGSQRTYLRLEADQQLAQAVGAWKFCDAPFGAGHTLTGSTAGFFGATPVAKPTVTGSRGGNAAVASLLTALANLGLITDGSSA